MTIVSTVSAGLPHSAPKAKSDEQLSGLTDIFAKYPVNKEIVVVNTNNLTEEQVYTVVSLQGLVSKKAATIFIDKNASGTAKTAKELSDYGYEVSLNDESGKQWNFESLMKKFATSEYIKDCGYILYSSCKDVHQLNMATNMATVYGWLPVPKELESVATGLGMTKCEDLTDDTCSYAQQLKFYTKHKKIFSDTCLVHQPSTTYGLRDLAIQQNIFVMYTLEDDTLGKALRSKVLRGLNKGSPVLGWCNFEVQYVEAISATGNFVIPTDHCTNSSMLCSMNIEAKKYNKPIEDICLNPDKHYIVLCYSDGDNVQWIQNGYNDFYNWQKLNVDVPLTWTFPPLMKEFSSIDMNRVLSSADDDCFISGPSGAGYSRLSQMYGKGLEAFSDLTAASMLESGMTTVTLLDTEFDNKIEENSFINKLGYFSRYSNIKGGIIQFEPDRYASGKGRVYFVDDKPFVSVRLSLWHPDGEGATVTNEWIQEQADIINSYPADINSINGYSVVNIHPWTMSVENVAYFVSLLDEDIEVITADELVCAVSKYVPHKNAQP
ncbi:MAG: hypothetical protein IJZ57_09225 [Clostridia bacterium]|nr:hypothetical protein [Clostridia bacterium]